MKDVAGPDKKEAGLLLNALKVKAEDFYAQHEHMKGNQDAGAKGIDVSMPATAIETGTRHPLRVVENQIVSIFEKLGFVASVDELKPTSKRGRKAADNGNSTDKG